VPLATLFAYQLKEVHARCAHKMNIVDRSMAQLATVFRVTTLFVLWFSTTCAAGSSPRSNNETAEKSQNLVGKWKKISTAKCDEAYPDKLEFFEGTYLGKKGQSGQRFIVWDAGGYQVIAADRVKIDIATDEQIVYRFSILEDVLTFVDGEGCEFTYRRVV
jgi:hypothetical protein